jgi:hypothetical protein
MWFFLLFLIPFVIWVFFTDSSGLRRRPNVTKQIEFHKHARELQELHPDWSFEQVEKHLNERGIYWKG